MRRGLAALVVLLAASGCIGLPEGDQAIERLEHASDGPAPHDIAFQGELHRVEADGLALRLTVVTADLAFPHGVGDEDDLGCARPAVLPDEMASGPTVRSAHATFEPEVGPRVHFGPGSFTIWGEGALTASAPMAFRAPSGWFAYPGAFVLDPGSSPLGPAGTVEMVVGPEGVVVDGVWVQMGGSCQVSGPGRLSIAGGTYSLAGRAGIASGTVEGALQAEEPATVDLGATRGTVTSPAGLHWNPPELHLLATALGGTVEVASRSARLEATVEQAWSNMAAFTPLLRLAALDGADRVALEVPRGGQRDVWLKLGETSGRGTAVAPVLLAIGDDLDEDLTVSLSRSLSSSVDSTPSDDDFVTQRRVFWEGDADHTIDAVRAGAHGYVMLRVTAVEDARLGTESFDVQLRWAGSTSQGLQLEVKVV